MDIEIAKNIPLLDVVVGGHSHTFLAPPLALQVSTCQPDANIDSAGALINQKHVVTAMQCCGVPI